MPRNTIFCENDRKTELKTISKAVMEKRDVIDLVELLESENIDVWLDGGWGVDALLEEQTRPHADVDMVVQQKDVPKLQKLLRARNYADVERDDTSAWNFVLGDNKGREVDVHAIVFDKEGNGLYGPKKKGYVSGRLAHRNRYDLGAFRKMKRGKKRGQVPFLY